MSVAELNDAAPLTTDKPLTRFDEGVVVIKRRQYFPSQTCNIDASLAYMIEPSSFVLHLTLLLLLLLLFPLLLGSHVGGGSG